VKFVPALLCVWGVDVTSVQSSVVFAREVGLFALLIAATFTDIAYGKVYNWLTYPCIVLGMMLAAGGQAAGAPEASVVESLTGLAAAAGIFGFFFLRNWMGAADVKLAAAIGALKGFGFFLWALVYITLAGFMLAVVVLIWQGRFVESVRNSFVFFLRPGKLRKRQEANGREPVFIPYGAAMAVGTMCAWFIQRYVQHGWMQ